MTTGFDSQANLVCRLKQLDRISVGIFQLDLLSARTNFHCISKVQTGAFQRFHLCRQVVHLQKH